MIVFCVKVINALIILFRYKGLKKTLCIVNVPIIGNFTKIYKYE
jgi:hypothetical protein